MNKAFVGPKKWLTGMSAVWDALEQGGVMVETPREAPSLITLLQLDGDMVSFVAGDLFTRYPTVELREQLIRDHLSALTIALPHIPPAPAILGTIGWSLSGVMQAGVAVHWIVAGWSELMVLAHIGALTPIGMRFLGPSVLLRSLRWLLNSRVRKRRSTQIDQYNSGQGVNAFKAR